MSIELDAKHVFSGNILFFYAFDIGDDIDFEKIKKESLVDFYEPSLSPYFKNYHIPLFFHLQGKNDSGFECIFRKLHSFGVLSFCYKIGFKESFEELKAKVEDLETVCAERAVDDASVVFSKLGSSVKEPKFTNLESFYFVVQVDPMEQDINAQQFKDFYGSKIASLLRRETKKLSKDQEKQILNSTMGYYGKDLVIIDSEGSFLYDDEFWEPLEFFELANIQQLELQYFDKLLADKLSAFYKKPYTVPFRSYIPLFGKRSGSPISNLSNLRVDISMITERLENSIKMAGDTYYSNLYSMLVANLSLREWKDSIRKKMDIIKDIYQVQQDRLDTIREEILTIVIIILIALEAWAALIH